MGKDFKDDINDDKEGEMMEKAESLIDGLKDFGGHLETAMAEGRVAIEKKNELQSNNSKKKSGDSSASGGEDDMSEELDIEDIKSYIDKVRAVAGDMTLTETKEWLDENEDLVRGFME